MAGRVPPPGSDAWRGAGGGAGAARAALEEGGRLLAARCPGRVTRDRPLAPLTTFRLGGPAAVFLDAATLDDLAASAEVLARVELPLLVIGRGSNLLVADAGWPGLVVHLGSAFRWIRRQGEELEAGAATPMPALASRSAAERLGGLSFAVAIPGTVGGGVRMNAGAHGTEVADRLRWAEAVPLAGPGAGRPARLATAELGLAYRRSALPAAAVVTRARFRLQPAPEAQVRSEIDQARRWRREHQPVNEPNCGSVFANPPEMSAGRVVELLGMKGERAGGASFSEVHANFIVARGGAQAADVLELVRRAQRRAREELGVQLRTEVQIKGCFAESEVWT
jgi:UDP-N-acetylmuramate dehydrogenase